MSKKTKFPFITLFVIFAVIAILVIFLIRAFLNYRESKQSQTVVVKEFEGLVTANNRNCFSSSECYLTVKSDNSTYQVIYLPSEGDCKNKVSPGVAWETNIDDRVQVKGRILGNKIYICDSEEYFVKSLK